MEGSISRAEVLAVGYWGLLEDGRGGSQLWGERQMLCAVGLAVLNSGQVANMLPAGDEVV